MRALNGSKKNIGMGNFIRLFNAVNESNNLRNARLFDKVPRNIVVGAVGNSCRPSAARQPPAQLPPPVAEA